MFEFSRPVRLCSQSRTLWPRELEAYITIRTTVLRSFRAVVLSDSGDIACQLILTRSFASSEATSWQVSAADGYLYAPSLRLRVLA
jgi:hypothetical protein